MRLRELAGIDSDSEVTGFAIDHRKVAPGSIFGAFRGARFNGEDFIPEAVDSRRGRGCRAARGAASTGVPHLADPEPRAAVRQPRGEILRALSRGRSSP